MQARQKTTKKEKSFEWYQTQGPGRMAQMPRAGVGGSAGLRHYQLSTVINFDCNLSEPQNGCKILISMILNRRYRLEFMQRIHIYIHGLVGSNHQPNQSTNQTEIIPTKTIDSAPHQRTPTLRSTLPHSQPSPKTVKIYFPPLKHSATPQMYTCTQHNDDT